MLDEILGDARARGASDGRARRRLAVVAAVLLAALLAVAALAWVVGSSLASGERDDADVRLAATVRAAGAHFRTEVVAANARAVLLARSPRLQRALAARDRGALARQAARTPSIAFYAGGRLLAGKQPGLAVQRSVDVRSRGRLLGRVVAAVPLGDALLDRLSRGAQLAPDDGLVLVVGDRVVAGGVGTGEAIALATGRPARVRLGSETYRALAAPLLGGGQAELVALTPEAGIDSRVTSRRRRVFLAALVTLATLGLLAYAVLALRPRTRRDNGRYAGPRNGRTHTGRRRDAREALALVGDALAATHDPSALLPVILETALEATGAVGGRLLHDGREVAAAGETTSGAQALTLPLGEDTDGKQSTLHLIPPSHGFSEDELELARWFASQASIALANARLHGVVKRQAVTDELTELANRRRFMQALDTEISRAQRFGSALAVVLADLDDFKRVNDRFGHQTGDEVLGAFADVLRERLRDIDVPARLGGEEFAILLPETDLAGAEQLAERLRLRLVGSQLTLASGRKLRVTASFGIAAYPDAESAEELLSTADVALYRAKAAGKNRVISAGEPMVPPRAPSS